MIRFAGALFFSLSILCSAAVARSDPWFSKLPVAQWLTEGETSAIPWSADILPAALSPHQRLMLRIVVRLYGSEIEKRRGAGEFVTLVQYTDSAGRVWQHHTSLDLATLAAGTGTRQLAIAQYAYLLPGDYSLAIAICDTATLEHGVITRQVYVPPLTNDPLPRAWTNLPAVDFIPPITDPPDVWYLPGVEGRLNLPVVTRTPVHIHLIVNLTPSWGDASSIAALHRNMNALIPIMKVLSQIALTNGSMDLALLDLTSLRLAFEQKIASSLDWGAMRKVFLDAKPGIVDAHALADRGKMTSFFRDEITRRLLADQNGSATPVVVVLSGPAFLDDQVPAPPPGLPADLNYRIFYIRWHGLPAPARDDLQRAVEPLKAWLYDAASNDGVRQVVSSVLDEIRKL